MNFYDEDAYREASFVANSIAKRTAEFYGIEVKNVKNFHIKDFVEEDKLAVYAEHYFKPPLDKLMLGSTQKIEGILVLAVNALSMVERRYFSEMHETIHAYCDPIKENDGRAFSDLLLEEGYLPEDEYIEKRANFGAGILMANDEALIFGINKFRNFLRTANFFFMSKSAYRNRLRSFLVFERDCTPQYAFQLVQRHEHGQSSDFYKIINMY
ncbi:ImmA/IrrE family metallo-endopeptidase [Enterococcus devriesei]|uniref:ImmA/IrrE family metallo-endopeptidase n=1 Tax=Enterococcus devriesei TaxID=319970 RepID=UPI0028E96B02|nr:ImmA/IrrE family metallo-endopeptidase [Enterococcus devriesei]